MRTSSQTTNLDFVNEHFENIVFTMIRGL